MGRLSELTGAGREPFWDRWKDAVATWNYTELQQLAADLESQFLSDSPAPED